MAKWRADIIRHLLMRFTLGTVLGWFGIQQILSPAEWIDFVPAIFSRYSPIMETDLILLHGSLLILAGAGILLGVVFMGASLLAAGLLIEIIISLFLVGSPANLIVRDMGLLGLAIALVFDSTRFWHLELGQWLRLSPIRPNANPGNQTSSLGWKALWRVRIVSVTFLAFPILAMVFLIGDR